MARPSTKRHDHYTLRRSFRCSRSICSHKASTAAPAREFDSGSKPVDPVTGSHLQAHGFQSERVNLADETGVDHGTEPQFNEGTALTVICVLETKGARSDGEGEGVYGNDRRQTRRSGEVLARSRAAWSEYPGLSIVCRRGREPGPIRGR